MNTRQRIQRSTAQRTAHKILLLLSGQSPAFVRDMFTTAWGAGSVDGTSAQPGPGTRIIDADTGNNISISGGKLVFAGGTGGWNATRLRLSEGITRAAGQSLSFRVTVQDTGEWFACGFKEDPISHYAGFQFSSSSRLVILNNLSTGSTALIAAEYAVGTYDLMVVLRANGAFYFIKGGAFADWTLLYPHNLGSDTPLYFAAETFSTTADPTFDDVVALQAAVAVTPAASDSFNRANGALGGTTTDGAGHEEANGGSGLTWVAQEGNFNIINTAEASPTALGTGGAFATVDTGKTNVVVEAKIESTGAPVGLVLRWVDNQNYVFAYTNASAVSLRKVVGGSSTILINVVTAYSADARLIVTADGTKFRLYYNDAVVGTEQTISDAALQSSTKHGLYANGMGSVLKIEDFVVWNRK